jgi:hypothetical protein
MSGLEALFSSNIRQRNTASITPSAVFPMSSDKNWLSVLGYVANFFSYKLCVYSKVCFAVNPNKRFASLWSVVRS